MPPPLRLARTGAGLVVAAVLSAAVVGCAADGGTDAGRESPDAPGSTAGPGSDPGATEATLARGTDDVLVQEALAAYTDYVREQVDQTVTTTREMAGAIKTGDLETAKSLYAPSRQGWERIEPIAELVEEIDGKIDARVDDFASVDDPEFTGWHRIEHLLWEQEDTEAAVPFVDQLLADLATLQTELDTIEIPPGALPRGAAELIEEVSGGKITGEEDRYSGTDLWDVAANVEGSRQIIVLLTPALEQADAALLGSITTGFDELEAALATYADGQGGYQPYSALTEQDKTAMQSTLADLSEHLSQVSGALGLG